MAIAYRSPNSGDKSRGFTLVELMIVLVLLSIIFAGLTTTFNKQQDIYNAQEQEVQALQNLRAARYTMTREIRMAGYDPNNTGLYGITSATSSNFAFTSHLDSNVATPPAIASGESFQYQLYDSDGDGVNDALRRTVGGSPMANDIYNLFFVYELQNLTQTAAPIAADYPNIRRVRVFMLARTNRTDKDYVDLNPYVINYGPDYDGTNKTVTWPAAKDHYHRYFVTTEITLRNMGL